MPKIHQVKQGETLPEIARRYGFLNWEIIKNHPDNKALFETRREGVLHPGDAITIPDRDASADAAGTRATHRYVVPKPVRILRLRLLDGANEPLTNFAYEITIGSDAPLAGTTDGDGVVHHEVPEPIKRAKIVVETPTVIPEDGPALVPKTRYERNLELGHLDPATKLTGLHARLQNLGYFFGPIRSPHTIHTRLAIYKFKREWIEHGEDEEVDAELDAKTLERLVEVHDNVVKSGQAYADPIPDPLPRDKQRSRRFERHLVAPVHREDDASFNAIRLSPPPDLIFDAHMHIQSNNCAPMPLVWGRLPGPVQGVVGDTPRRDINWVARSWLGQKITGDFGVVGAKTTDQIGDIAAEHNRTTFANATEFPRTNADEQRLTPMIVLPMDMELAHLDGYFAEPIYYAVASRKEHSDQEVVPSYSPYAPPAVIDVWRPMGPAIPRFIDPSTGRDYTPAQKAEAERARDAHIRGRGQTIREVSFQQRHGAAGQFYYFLEYDMDGWKSDNVQQTWTVKYVDDEEYDLYETFHEQRERTLVAVVRNPWSYMPLFHYEPRRWQLGGGGAARGVAKPWDEPFGEVATASKVGPYIGFKMYTPLGYRPSDYKRWLPRMADYFGRCESEEIPILVHCTPGGMYTNERELYYETEPESTKRTLRTRRGRDPSKADRITWYSNAFVSPAAWRPVLQRFPKLKLCLAHFVGDDWEDWRDSVRRNMATRFVMGERDPSVWWNEAGTGPWLKDIVKLIDDFDNVYTDISYFDVEKHEPAFTWLMNAYPKLKKRINFGTDWYMVENDIKGYDVYCKRMRAAIDRVAAEVFPDDPIPLWERFTRDNPLRCYRLLDSAANWAEGLKSWNASYARVARQQGKPWSKGDYDLKIDEGLQRFLRVPHLDPS